MSDIQEICYVTGNEGKVVETTRFLATYAPSIKLRVVNTHLEELQTLDEHEVIVYKARQAWEKLQQPLLVDDAGFYLYAYPKFPGVLTKPVIESLGFEGLYKLTAEDNRLEIYAWIVYVDKNGKMEYFHGSTKGRLVPSVGVDKAPYRFYFYTCFQPEGFNKTYAELWDDENARESFFRVRAVKKFANWFVQHQAHIAEANL